MFYSHIDKNSMKTLKIQYNTALELALKFHKNQKDKSGAPYIGHILRVSEHCRTVKAKIAALMHDLIEDTDLNLKNLQDFGFDDDILDAVNALTKIDNEKTKKYVDRILTSKIAIEVKLSDLLDNMDLSRLKNITEKDLKRTKKYKKMFKKLSKNLPKNLPKK